jgi:mannose-6-phosphate isomerase
MRPILFEPIFMERVWGGRRLEVLLGKRLPPGKKIGESWEIVDRPEAQSVVRQGPLKGKTLHELWCDDRTEIFGTGMPESPRFPILGKLLDATEKLSLQVHPPATVAQSLGGESKSELWYFVATEPGAEIFAGLRAGVQREQFANALHTGRIPDLVHRLASRAGESFFVPSGRLHGLGAGNVVVEIQQNSDTTYRVFDWDRRDDSDQPRDLHVAESMRSICFDDYEPEPVRAEAEQLLRCPHFVVEKWEITGERPALQEPHFALFVCLSGEIAAPDEVFRPGDFFLVPASGQKTALRSLGEKSTALRITLPAG